MVWKMTLPSWLIAFLVALVLTGCTEAKAQHDRSTEPAVEEAAALGNARLDPETGGLPKGQAEGTGSPAASASAAAPSVQATPGAASASEASDGSPPDAPGATDAAASGLQAASEGATASGSPGDSVRTPHLLDVPLIRQLPEYPNGCEVTSLAMLTAYLGLPYTKEELEALLPKDPTEPQLGTDGQLEVWGDPDRGFVGDIRGESIGYSINAGPLAQVFGLVYSAGARNLTGQDFGAVEQAVDRGQPVILWVTEDFHPVSEWVEWRTTEGRVVRAVWNIHAVLLVGYDEDAVYFNNPLTGDKGQKAERAAFIEAWEQLGRQALTYKEEHS
ncbi:C39 family peptidase [Gorillibacterium sp. sgz5001074]|uniref:C39 family peptidase n=1 Tax=Gorillibacterium sp. sgz5001074 TaxID=3446695 RepID=UPI003F6745FA